MKERISAKVRRKLAMLGSTGALWSFDKLSYRLDLRSARNLTLPHFLCIGAQKAGTNWVESLRCHPELYLSDTMELHYFDWRLYTSLVSYSEQFVDGKDRLLGEGYTGAGMRHVMSASEVESKAGDVLSQ